MRHTFTVHNWKDNRANFVQHQEVFMIILSNKKQEELTGKIKIQCAITSFFPKYTKV